MTFFRATYLRKNFTYILFFLLFGFLVGNLFGTLLNTLREFIVWDGFIIICILLVIEIISYANYSLIKLNDAKIASRAFCKAKDKRFYYVENKIDSLLTFLQRYVFVFLQIKKTDKTNKQPKHSWLHLIEPPNQVSRTTVKNYLFFNWRFIRLVNVFKIGLMIGFFVDAFKVGS